MGCKKRSTLLLEELNKVEKKSSNKSLIPNIDHWFNEETQNILIIAQTAYAMLGDKEKAIEAGCNDYITKPLESKKLQELVMTLLLN